MMLGRPIALLGVSVLAMISLLGAPNQPRAVGETVKVFILAGQSNMEGKIKNRLPGPSGDGSRDQRLVFAFARRRQVGGARRCVHQVSPAQRSVDDRLRLARPHRLGAGVRPDDGRTLRRAGDPDQGGVGRALAVQAVPLAVGRACPAMTDSKPSWSRLAKAAIKVEKSNEKSEKERPAADHGRHQVAVRLVLPQHDGRGEGRVRQLRDLVPRNSRVRKLKVAGFVWFQGFNDQWGDFAPGEYEVEHEAISSKMCART